MEQASLTDRVYQELRRDIIRQVYPSNSFLVEKTVSERYNCSKATAGEVLHLLCMRGFLESFPRKGYVMTIPTSKDFGNLQRLRYAIESMEIRWIIRNCSDEAIRAAMLSEGATYESMDNETFHLTMASLLDDKRLYGIMENLLGILVYTYSATPFFTSEKEIGNCHDELVAALLKRDIPAALDALKHDMQYTPDDED